MIPKKRIKIKPRDIDNKDKYYGVAVICPICGTNIVEQQNSSRVVDLCDDRVLYVVTRRNATCFCPTCGCSWSVKRFKHRETSE